MATWIGCAPKNFKSGRAGHAPLGIVIHRTERTLDRLRGRFKDPASERSAHYGVAADGTIEQYVSEGDTAFHAGVVVNPTWALLKAGINPNLYTVAIELEGEPDDVCPPLQVAAVSGLVVEIAARWEIPIDEEHVVPHRAIRASVDCPGSGFVLKELLDLAELHPAEIPAKTTQRTVRVIVNANVRRGAPNRTSPIARVILEGTNVPISGFTAAGERVNGNACWYVDGAGDFFWAGATDTPVPTAAAGSANPPAAVDEMDAVPAAPAPAAGAVTIDRTTLALPAHQYFAAKFKKDLIVLHFTAGGSARSAVNTWKANPEHVATAYVIDVDGTIYETFPPEFWAFHLGIKGGTAHERRSIGIEIANVGPLQPLPADPATLAWWPKNWTQPYCALAESDKYVASTYRGKQFFATFKDAQMDATAKLVAQLCERFAIPKQLPAKATRLERDNSFASYSGIATHVNFRDDKWDVGPAFNFDRLGI